MKLILPGLTGESEMVVREDDLVSHLGGIAVDVLTTPRLIQLLESAAVKAIERFVPSDQVTLGTRVEVKHLAPTPLGMRVTARALLRGVDKNRLFFLIDAYDEMDKVAEGEHERIIVSKERFLQRVEKKKSGQGG